MDRLPLEIIYNILSYNRNFVVKKGKLHTIRRLDMSKYQLEISPKRYVSKSYLLEYYCHYGFFVQFKNKNHRLYYKEGEEIEVVFETVFCSDDNLIVFWHTYYIE